MENFKNSAEKSILFSASTILEIGELKEKRNALHAYAEYCQFNDRLEDAKNAFQLALEMSRDIDAKIEKLLKIIHVISGVFSRSELKVVEMNASTQKLVMEIIDYYNEDKSETELVTMTLFGQIESITV
jgi:hypothetical protein